MDRLKRFYINGILLTAVALMIRYVGVNFNVYLSERIGAVAMGIFTLVSGVYGFALTIATSGLSLATTKLVSESLGRASRSGSYALRKTVRAIMKRSLCFSLCISTATAIALYSLAPCLGEHALRDVRTVSSLRILAASLPAIAVSSSLGGYFSALRRVYKNAIVQILCQALRIYFSVILLSLFFAKDMESACIAIVLGIMLSEVVAALFHFALYLLDKEHSSVGEEIGITDTALPKKLLPITVPVALSAYMRSALITVEHLLIPWGLEQSGASRDISLAAYGTVHSLVFPLILFPSAISASFAGLLVPEISESNAASESNRIERITSRVLKSAIIYSVGVAGIMTCFSLELGDIFIGNKDSALYIAMLAPLIPIMYLDTSVDSILKGLGHQLYSMIVNIADATLSVILVWILLPRFGIMGYIATVYFTEIVNAALSITKLLIVTRTRINLFDLVGKPLLSVIAATCAIRLFDADIRSRGLLILFIAATVIIYAAMLIMTKAINMKSLKRAVRNFFNSK